jgi:hypothetical protein
LKDLEGKVVGFYFNSHKDPHTAVFAAAFKAIKEKVEKKTGSSLSFTCCSLVSLASILLLVLLSSFFSPSVSSLFLFAVSLVQLLSISKWFAFLKPRKRKITRLP